MREVSRWIQTTDRAVSADDMDWQYTWLTTGPEAATTHTTNPSRQDSEQQRPEETTYIIKFKTLGLPGLCGSSRGGAGGVRHREAAIVAEADVHFIQLLLHKAQETKILMFSLGQA